MIALNKQLDTKFFLYDMSNLTDYNILNALGNYPREILTFFDPSIEFLNCREDEKEVNIQLKFRGKEEIRLKHPEELNRYLSSGTISSAPPSQIHATYFAISKAPPSPLMSSEPFLRRYSISLKLM